MMGLCLARWEGAATFVGFRFWFGTLEIGLNTVVLCFSIVGNATVFIVTGKLLLLVESVLFWGLFGNQKKKHISKMTW